MVVDRDKFNREVFKSLTLGERHLITWQYFDDPDSFNHRLFSLICRANEDNLWRIHTAFPSEVDAFYLYSRKDGWWQELEAQVFSKETP